jgi:hypothetical protein
MSDLDKWWVWTECVSDTSRAADDISQMHCVMSGKDIVRMYRDSWDEEQNAAYPLDEDIISYHRQLHWAVEAPVNRSQTIPWPVSDE